MIMAPNEPPLAAKFGVNNFKVVKTTLILGFQNDLLYFFAQMTKENVLCVFWLLVSSFQTVQIKLYKKEN